MPGRTCVLCERPHFCRGWCKLHYKRWYRWGDPHYVAKPDNLMQFLLDTYRLPVAHDPGWPASLHHSGYGYIRTEYGRMTCARYVAILTHGLPDPPELEASHLCPETRACFWSEHIIWETHAENMKRVER